MSVTGLLQILAGQGAAWAVGSLLKGTLLLLVVFLAAATVRRASAGLRHLVWGGGIVAVLVLPLVSLVLPWRLPVLRMPAAPASVVATPAGQAPGIAPAGAAPAAPSSRPAPDVAAGPGVAPQAGGRGVAAARAWLARVPPAWWIAAVWAAGALVVLLRLARGALLVRRVRRDAEALASPDWRQPLIEAADRLGLAREPRLLTSDAVLMPIVCGVLDPAIVLPAGAAEWTGQRRRAVLCHELAHVRRSDLALTILSRVGCAVYWFHPLFWVAARKLRLESERACDDLVLEVGTRPSEYADHLLQIACLAGSMRSPAAALPMAERREFEGRMLAILERGARRSPPSRRLAVLLAVLALAVVVPVAAMGLAQAPPAGVPGPAPQPEATPHPPATPEPGPAQAPQAASARARTATRTAVTSTFTTTVASSVKQGVSTVLSHLGSQVAEALQGQASGDSIDPRTLAALLRTLEDSVADVRTDAAYALGQLEAHAATGALTAHLRRDASAEVREMAAWALGQIESHEATASLVAAARGDASEDVRAMAVWALGQVDDAAAAPGLAAVLGDASAEVRGRAAWALGSIGAASAPAALIAALRDPSPAVRLRAAWALGQIEDPRAAPALAAALADSSAEARRAIVWALGRLDAPEGRQALLEALKSPDPQVRAQAARALGGSEGNPWPWPWPMPLNR